MPRIAFVILAAIAVVVAMIAGRFMVGDDSQSQASRVNIGGPFTLNDHTGKRVTQKDFEGKYMLIYFGYTFCPDVCPTSLSIMSEALDMLSPEQLAKVTPVFVSVDSDRDTPEVLASYVPHFHDNMVGLSGSKAEIKAVTRAYKSYFAKVNEDDPDGNYTMDHSSVTYLMGPDGAYVAHFSHGTKSDKMAARLQEIL